MLQVDCKPLGFLCGMIPTIMPSSESQNGSHPGKSAQDPHAGQSNGLFGNRPKEDHPTDNPFWNGASERPSKDAIQVPGTAMTYKQYGFIQSHHHGASPVSLDVELKKIHESYKESKRKDDAEQIRLKEPVRVRLESLRVDLEALELELEQARNETIPGIHAKMEDLRNEIAEIRRNPAEYQEQRPNRVSYAIGIIVLCVLTLYLWVFYTSAGYSAFFRTFQADDINVANSIFDAQAIVKAWNQGLPSFMLVVSMPFIFLALGFLIHKAMHGTGWGRWVRIILLALVTLCFDCIIAYEIVSKIHELKAAASLDPLPPYTFQDVFRDVNFWLIIFAGFVTYLIWGFLFDRIMEEFERFDGVGHQVRLRQAELKEWAERLAEAEARPAQIRERINEVRKQIKAMESDLAGVLINPKDFEHIVFQFTSGWLQFIEGGMLADAARKDGLRIECRRVADDFVAAHRNPLIDAYE